MNEGSDKLVVAREYPNTWTDNTHCIEPYPLMTAVEKGRCSEDREVASPAPASCSRDLADKGVPATMKTSGPPTAYYPRVQTQQHTIGTLPEHVNGWEVLCGELCTRPWSASKPLGTSQGPLKGRP